MKRRIFTTLLVFCMCLVILPATVFAAEVYSTEDIAAINRIIDEHPELDWEKAPADGSSKPDDWNNKVYWNFEVSPRRVCDLDLMGKGLTGSLNVSGLSDLTNLNCSFNQLTGLDISGLTALKKLDCRFNQLTGTFDVSGMATLTSLDCSFNQLTGLTLNNGVNYEKIDARANCMTDTSAVTGPEIPWEDVNLQYQFNPQHYTIRNILTNMTTDNPANFYLMTDWTDYTATLSADDGYMLPAEISVRVGGTELAEGEDKDYTYDSRTGDLTIFIESLEDNLEQPNIFVYKSNFAVCSGGGVQEMQEI
ncbi:MAG TPA: leucine-rich repeat domain-containing protein [Clostridiaceae bacterium]|nr:leucine-rich repeat domain-containing protein [Clostridiaceae bacterium]